MKGKKDKKGVKGAKGKKGMKGRKGVEGEKAPFTLSDSWSPDSQIWRPQCMI